VFGNERCDKTTPSFFNWNGNFAFANCLPSRATLILPMSDLALDLRSFPYAASLRAEIAACNRRYSTQYDISVCESMGRPPVLCYAPSDDGLAHGNFFSESYRAILKNDNWKLRLAKVHTQARQSLPRNGYRWRELDSSNSSDALLMNIFCCPGMLRLPRLRSLLGISAETQPCFGVRARVPLANGRFDRTEIDMQIGDLLVEAKLTESDFQSKAAGVVEGYRDFSEVFDADLLPRSEDLYLSYQLIRNVLAAHASNCSFCVMMDARRPDLQEAWFAVMRSIRISDLRLRCRILTWQELATVAPPKLKNFLAQKYGIGYASTGTCDDESLTSTHIEPRHRNSTVASRS
jgi:hypothetical protein